jgi:hypothetical protein
MHMRITSIQLKITVNLISIDNTMDMLIKMPIEFQ